jgi:hypothetical protein
LAGIGEKAYMGYVFGAGPGLCALGWGTMPGFDLLAPGWLRYGLEVGEDDRQGLAGG